MKNVKKKMDNDNNNNNLCLYKCTNRKQFVHKVQFEHCMIFVKGHLAYIYTIQKVYDFLNV